MPRMIELIRQSAVPPTVMHSAACGVLDVPRSEAVEILVYLTTVPQFTERAVTTLTAMDDMALLPVVSDPNAPKEVLNYFLAPIHRRSGLLEALISNPSVAGPVLRTVAETAGPELVKLLLRTERTMSLPQVLMGLAANPELDPYEREQLKQALQAAGQRMHESGEVFDHDAALFMMEHAADIAAEEGKQFELVESTEEERAEAAAVAAAAATAAATVAADAAAAAAAQAAADEGKISTLQKLARMSVGERVQRAFKGNKEERFILIRDGSKVVSHAVLESPKLTESEVETFAAMKNVQESVLRTISMKRKFMKNYAVIRALVNNPRCPLDVALNLLNHLHPVDMKNTSMNKNVSETLRKLAVKKFKEKTTAR